ncbi:hypothetical protein SMC26_03750 [Actinomadura fulvescens]|uniref:Uncharacterized protein n=1 Tax=Actinomadura fulvescens TaxID=46160 RepID=A0ABP6C5V7_9ACTN
MTELLRRIVCVGAVGVMAAGAGTAAASASGSAASGSAAAPGWRTVYASTSQHGSDSFKDVFALGPKNAWALGGADGSLLRHWNGTSWRAVAVPTSLVGADQVEVGRVVATSPKDVWVFGSAFWQDADERRVVYGLHWDGTRWTKKEFPFARINDVITTGKPGEVWVAAARHSCGHGKVCGPWIQRFDGKAWRKVPVPKSKAGAYRLSARKGTGVWATTDSTPVRSTAYRPGLVRWTGKRWQKVTGPKVVLPRGHEGHATDVLARGPRDVWTTITITKGGTAVNKSVLAHWNGKSWRQHVIRTKVLSALDGDGAGGIWALAGDPGRGAVQAMAHWSKGKVRFHRVPGVRNRMDSISDFTLIPGTRSVWAAGHHRRPTPMYDIQAMLWKYGA